MASLRAMSINQRQAARKFFWATSYVAPLKSRPSVCAKPILDCWNFNVSSPSRTSRAWRFSMGVLGSSEAHNLHNNIRLYSHKTLKRLPLTLTSCAETFKTEKTIRTMIHGSPFKKPLGWERRVRKFPIIQVKHGQARVDGYKRGIEIKPKPIRVHYKN